MYSVLVCEDERLIRQKMMRGLDWEANGFGPVMEAERAEDAVGILSRHTIDVLVTDIRLPGMNGIQLVERTRQCSPETKVVVISGYSEFEYARALMKLNVHDYVLKPFRSRKLLDVLSEIKQRIADEESRQRQLRGLQEQLERHRVPLTEKLLLEAIRRPWSDENRLAEIGDEFERIDNSTLTAAVVAIEPSVDASADSHDQDRQVLRAIERFLGQRNLHWKALLNQPRQLAIVATDSSSDLQSSIDDLLRYLKTQTTTPLTIGVGQSCGGLSTLWRSFQEACVAAGHSYMHGAGMVYRHSDSKGRTDGSAWNAGVSTLNEICSFLRTGTFPRVHELTDELFAHMHENTYERPVINAIVTSLILASCVALKDVGQDISRLTSPHFDPISAVNRCRSLEELRVFVRGFYGSIELYAKNERKRNTQDTVEQIRAFVEQNFDRDITLEFLARRFGKSPSYISTLLSEHLGQGFSAYLSALRIRKAVQLLRFTDLRVYEIAERVGFRDAYYFSSRFKYLTGVSPTECREAGGNPTPASFPEANLSTG